MQLWPGRRGPFPTRGTARVDSPRQWQGERHPIVSLKKMTQTVRRSLPFPAGFQESCSGIMDRVIRGSMQRQAAGGEPARLQAPRGPGLRTGGGRAGGGQERCPPAAAGPQVPTVRLVHACPDEAAPFIRDSGQDTVVHTGQIPSHA